MSHKNFFYLFIILCFFVCTLAAESPYEFQTERVPGVAETRLLVPSTILEEDEEYFAWEDIRDFFRSALPSAEIKENPILHKKQLEIPGGTLRLFFNDNMVLWNNRQIRVASPLIRREGRSYVHKEVMNGVAELSGLFFLRRIDEMPEPPVEEPPEEDREEFVPEEDIDAPEVPVDFRIGLLLNFSDELSEQRKETIQRRLKKVLEEYFSPRGEIVVFERESPLVMAEKINRENLECFIKINFAGGSETFERSGRIFFITSQVHPVHAQQRGRVMGHEYSTNFRAYEEQNKKLAMELGESMDRLTTIRMLRAAEGMIQMLQYLSLPSVVIELYNIDLEDDIEFYSSEENLLALSRAMKSGVKDFIE